MRFLTYSILAFILFSPSLVFAQEFLVGIPGLNGDELDFNAFINAVYITAISIAAMLAVIKIIIAGVKYMFTDIVTQKGAAKKDIKNSLFGLLIVLGAVLILQVINPELTTFDPEFSEVRNPPQNLTQADQVFIEQTGAVEQGFRHIPIDADFETRARFIISCSGEVQIRQDQVRCYELDELIEEGVREDLSSLEEDVVDIIIEQYELYLGERLILDESILEAIDAEWSSSGDDLEVIFAVEMPIDGIGTEQNGFGLGYESQVEGVCARYQEANPDKIVELVSGETSQNYNACILINT